MKKQFVPLLLLAALIAFPWVVQHPYYQHLMILVLMWVTIGSAWNLIAGYTGQVSFGNAAFFGVGAYAAGLLAVKLDISAWWGIGLGGIVAMMLALPFGWICFKLRGAYFALGTLALGEILHHVAKSWESLTQGMVGLLIIQTFVSKVPYYYIALALAILSVLSIQLVMESRFGFYFVSIREDQDAAESIGIDTRFYKMISLCITAFLTGAAGALYMNYMGFIDPTIAFSLHDISIMAILVGIVGGVATIYGPTVGAFVMVGLQEAFRTGGFGLLEYATKLSGSPVVMQVITKYVKEAHVLSFGVLVILVIMFLPNGIVGDWGKIKRALSFSKKGETS